MAADFVAPAEPWPYLLRSIGLPNGGASASTRFRGTLGKFLHFVLDSDWLDSQLGRQGKPTLDCLVQRIPSGVLRMSVDRVSHGRQPLQPV